MPPDPRPTAKIPPAPCSLPPLRRNLCGLGLGAEHNKVSFRPRAVCAFAVAALASLPLQQSTAPPWRSEAGGSAPPTPTWGQSPVLSGVQGWQEVVLHPRKGQGCSDCPPTLRGHSSASCGPPPEICLPGSGGERLPGRDLGAFNQQLSFTRTHHAICCWERPLPKPPSPVEGGVSD